MDRGRQVLEFLAMDSISIPGAEIYYNEHFLQPDEASQFFDQLLSKCAWERHSASFGHTVPRDEAYYGDPGTHYTYSRREYKPLPWIPELLSLEPMSKRPLRRRPMPICPCRELATTPCSAICIGREMTASACMPMLSRR